jgi:hypothetical protein
MLSFHTRRCGEPTYRSIISELNLIAVQKKVSFARKLHFQMVITVNLDHYLTLAIFPGPFFVNYLQKALIYSYFVHEFKRGI